MKEFLSTINNWKGQQKSFVVARVIKTWGSSPRPIGSTMLISEDLEMVGSVSGGCVEGAVLKAAAALLATGGSRMLSFGVSNEEAWQVGLTCGGQISVLLNAVNPNDESSKDLPPWQNLTEALQKNESAVLLTKLADGPNVHVLFRQTQDDSSLSTTTLSGLAYSAYKQRKNQILEWRGKSYFAHVLPRKSQLLIIGAAHITVDLVRLAALYDFETVVIDPRGIFTQKTQFDTSPDHLHELYPEEVLSDYRLDQYTFAVILSHDPKIDDNALSVLLPSKVAYIGALGSRKTQAKRIERLQTAGYTDEQIARIHAPIGIDINAKKPREIALSILAEIIKVQNQFL